VPARLINIKYITIRGEKVASPVTALHPSCLDVVLKLLSTYCDCTGFLCFFRQKMLVKFEWGHRIWGH